MVALQALEQRWWPEERRLTAEASNVGGREWEKSGRAREGEGETVGTKENSEKCSFFLTLEKLIHDGFINTRCGCEGNHDGYKQPVVDMRLADKSRRFKREPSWI